MTDVQYSVFGNWSGGKGDRSDSGDPGPERRREKWEMPPVTLHLSLLTSILRTTNYELLNNQKTVIIYENEFPFDF